MIKSWGALFALVGLFGLGGAGLFMEYSKPNDYEQPAKANYRNGQVLKSRAADEYKNEKGSDKESWYKDVFDKPTDWLIALFTFFLVLYTRKLNQATVGLVDAAAEQSRDMKASVAVAQISAEAAKKSADAAVASVRAIATAIPLSLAGKIVRPPGVPPNIVAGGIEPDRAVLFVIQNHGKSPAIISNMNIEAQVRDALPSREDLRKVKAGGVVGEWLVQGEKSSRQILHEFFSTDEEFGRIIGGNANLFFYGIINYSDVFGGSHSARVAFQFVPGGIGNPGGGFRTVGEPKELNSQE